MQLIKYVTYVMHNVHHIPYIFNQCEIYVTYLINWLLCQKTDN